MVRGPPRRLRINPAKTQLTQIKLINKDVNHANRIVLLDPVLQAFGKKHRLPAIRPLNEALHPIPPQIARKSYHTVRFHTARVESGYSFKPPE